MKRSTIQLGGKTLLISLPHQWVTRNGVRKGQELSLTEEEQGLLISVEAERPKRIVALNARTCGKLLRRIVLGCYLEGVHEIRITHSSEHVAQLHDLSKEFIGFDIVRQDSATTIFQDFAHENENNIHAVVTRAFYILKAMIAEGKESLKRNDKKILAVITAFDVALNKATHYSYRYSRKNDVPKEEALIIPLISSTLESCGDVYKSTIALALNETSTKEHIIMHDHIEALLDAVLKLTLNRTTEHAIECANAYDSAIKTISKKNQTRTTDRYREIIGNMISLQSCQLGMLKEIEKINEGALFH